MRGSDWVGTWAVYAMAVLVACGGKTSAEGPRSAEDRDAGVVPTPPPPLPPNCFGAGTPIATPLGELPIERIAIGDRVLAYDFAAGHVVSALVVATMKHEDASLLRLPVPYAAELAVTAEHPIYSVNTGAFEPAGTLDGDVTLLALTSLESALATRVEMSLTPEPRAATVYNLTVDTFHNYFAGGVLVHNKAQCWPENGCERCADGTVRCFPGSGGPGPIGPVVDAAANAAEGGASGADGSGGAGGDPGPGGAGGEGGR